HLAQARRVGDPVPDKIEAALAWREIVIKSGDRVGDHLLLLWQIEGEQRIDRAQRRGVEVGFVGRPPPDVIAGINRLHVRRQLRTNAGADTVAADQDIGVLDAATRKMDTHATLILVDTLEIPAEVKMRRRYGGAQQPLQTVP